VNGVQVSELPAAPSPPYSGHVIRLPTLVVFCATTLGPWSVATAVCGVTPLGGCIAAATACLSVNEKKAGNEKLKAVLKTFDQPTSLGDFGDPVNGTTRYDLCLYDGQSGLAGELNVARGRQSCGPKGKDCWKRKGNRGWKYKDPDASADGVAKVVAISGPAGKGKLQVQAANRAKKSQLSLPTGIAAALAGAQSATLQIVASDGSCFDAALGTVSKADGSQFKAKAP
jgi:hypothetical protein